MRLREDGDLGCVSEGLEFGVFIEEVGKVTECITGCSHPRKTDIILKLFRCQVAATIRPSLTRGDTFLQTLSGYTRSGGHHVEPDNPTLQQRTNDLAPQITHSPSQKEH
jgi:hypothetical protein